MASEWEFGSVLGDAPEDLTTLACWGTDPLFFSSLPEYFGQETIKIVTRKSQDKTKLRTRYPNIFVIHQRLLCLQSRFFNTKLDRYLERKALADVITQVEATKEENVLLDSRECNPLLQEKGVPLGYVPSWVEYARSYRKSAELEPEQALVEGPQADNTIVLPDEDPRVFALFVHWLYAQDLKTDSEDIKLDSDHVCILLYALAERLDVPRLRQACYSELRESYRSSKLPTQEVIGALVEQCSLGSKLRAYFVRLFTHAVVSQTIDERGNAMIDEYFEFSNDVARKVLECLRLHLANFIPYKIEDLDNDESDYDLDDLSDDRWTESGSEVDSHCMMSISNDGETDSLFTEAIEETEVQEGNSEFSQLAAQLGLDIEHIPELAEGSGKEGDDEHGDGGSQDAEEEDLEESNDEEDEEADDGDENVTSKKAATQEVTLSKTSSANPRASNVAGIHEREPTNHTAGTAKPPFIVPPHITEDHRLIPTHRPSKEDRDRFGDPNPKPKRPMERVPSATIKHEDLNEQGILVEGYPVIKRKRDVSSTQDRGEADKENHQRRKRSAIYVVDLT
ncbi:MAG: rRNA-processing protein bfr2 [Icmadophila ericetorum]|nr:rRNA-processing protein bfr2 [Icmadophila ericetorum]